MKSIFDIRSEVVRLVEARRCHFCSFRRAANYREGRGTRKKKHLRQFKTEKWLQAELVHHFSSNGIDVIPEYPDRKWDLCIEKPNGEGNFLLAIKCLADSDQSAKGDFDGVSGVGKDIEAVSKHPSSQAALVLILPLGANDRKRTNYTKKMLEYIEQRDSRKTLALKKDAILFAPNSDEGVWVVWIEPK